MIPKNCSIRVKGVPCFLPPSHLVSIKTLGEEYLIGVTCNEHTQLVKKIISKRINSSKESVNIQAINLVATDCIINIKNKI
jgi:hypothetical protein